MATEPDKSAILADLKAVQKGNASTFWQDHRITLLLVLTVAVAIFFVVAGMTAYNISGAAQLDLSRPGYQSVSDKIEPGDTINEYEASGPVNTETINEFLTLFDEQAEKVKGVDAFNGDPLNPEVLYAEPANNGQ